MYNYRNRKKLIYNIILILLLAIGIGYAYLTSNLSISGNTQVTTNTWNIHFENLNITNGSVTTSSPATISASGDAITYSINLSRPKDFYEFTVDVKNSGTLPGKIGISSLAGITSVAEPIIDYSIKYTNGNPVNEEDILNAGAKKSIKVRVFYKDEINPEDFPSNDLNLILTYTLQYIQSEVDEINTDFIVQDLKTNNSSCFIKYTGQVTDQVGQTVTASNVYYNKCANKRNIKFAGYCWQMIRTTETGGIKMIYNGEPDNNGKCSTSRSDHMGIVGVNGTSETINEEYLYGSSFTYDTANNNFTLTDRTSAILSDSTYENLLGKFTCKNGTGTCTTLYNVNGYNSNTDVYLASYTIGTTNYAQIGTSSFNAYPGSLATEGYMFNKIYYMSRYSVSTGEILFGNDVSYNNGTYSLLPADGESELSTTKNTTHHYSCNTTSSTCNKVKYYYYENYYIELDGEQNIDEAVNNMLYSDNVNRYNSSIKGIIDAWYAQNLSSKTNMLEDTVYCNARNITNYEMNGWNKDGSLNEYTYFKNNTINDDLSCTNTTDQFSISNNKAKLKYPVSLLQSEELYNINESSLIKTSARYYTISPNEFFDGYSSGITDIGTNANIYFNGVRFASGVRPVITLKDSTKILSGSGSTSDPWLIQE